jgi:serine/threonine-protein kinase
MGVSQTLVVSGYQVVQYLGSGARSSIWQVRNNRTKQVFALKRVVKQHASDGRFLEQAVNEYNISQHLDHSTVRKIHQIRRVKRWLSLREIHLLMEYCQGKTVQEDRPTSILDVARIFNQVAGGLAHMNAQGFVHADTKPNNILVAADGTVKIIDLGQSCLMGTVKQRIQGTPDFIAPEQVRRLPLDGRTDVFNFGAALYWTLTGRPIETILPKKSGTLLVTDMKADPPEDLNPKVPPSLSRLTLDCIETSPSRRPASMDDVGSRLSLILYTLEREQEQQLEGGGDSDDNEETHLLDA